jgi:hypothetical protein
MELATSIGITINEFYEITPKELNIALSGYRKQKEYEAEEYKIKLKNEQQMLTVQAYQISRWVWAKKLDINKILKDMEPMKPKKAMTNDEMLKQAKLLNRLFGGEEVKDGTEK